MTSSYNSRFRSEKIHFSNLESWRAHVHRFQAHIWQQQVLTDTLTGDVSAHQGATPGRAHLPGRLHC
jgi:hypothetical protein